MLDIFALLTKYPKEGQPISILEAMGNGMYVVSTDYSGIIDIIDKIPEDIILKDYITFYLLLSNFKKTTKLFK